MCTKITELPDLEEDGISAEITHSAICKAPKVIFQLNIVISFKSFLCVY